MKQSLANMTCLNTRPAHQAEELNQAIHTLGGHTINFPCLEIQATNNTETLINTINTLQNNTIAIFTSANAVFELAKLKQFPLPHSPSIIAIGPATAAALKKQGEVVTAIPETFNSESLLDLPLLKKTIQKPIIIFCGANSRPLLKETLQKRGAKVTEAICYQRQKPTYTNRQIQKIFKHNKLDLIISTSYESLKNFIQLCEQTKQNDWRDIPILVVSEKMQIFAAERQLKTIRADSANVSSIIDSINNWTLNQTP